MPTESSDLRFEMIALLGRIVGAGPLPPDLQRKAMEMFEALCAQPGGTAPLAGADGGPSPFALAAAGPVGAAGAAIGNRRLVYVHGICQHSAGFSDLWWAALHPFVPAAFGPGTRGQTRLEVVWSDLVNQASAAFAAVGGPPGVVAAEQERSRAAEEIKEALRDRADQHVLNASVRADGLSAAGPMASPDAMGSLVSIPGLNCIDDFSIYLIDDGVRQQILNRFLNVVRPELQAQREIDLIAHSWGTVVAYEGLRQLEDEGLNAPLIRNFFTVGAALSIGPVKARLRPANKDGRKPASVRRWVNLDAHGDLVGGPLRKRPYAVDLDFLNLEAVGCNSLFGIVSPGCAHGSYFETGNAAVNRDIFARFIDRT